MNELKMHRHSETKNIFLITLGWPTFFLIIEILKDKKVITEKITFTSKQNFLCIRHQTNYCFGNPNIKKKLLELG